MEDKIETMFVALAFLVAGSGGTMVVLSDDEDSNIYNIEEKDVTHNVSCPTPEVEIERPIENIQNPDMSPDYRFDGEEFTLSEVDKVIKPTGKSMMPTIMTDDIVLLQERKDRELSTGMIVRVDKGGSAAIHRIVGDYTGSGYVLTKGDNNRVDDGRTPVENITHISLGRIHN